jgi:signal transduction histidine kinase
MNAALRKEVEERMRAEAELRRVQEQLANLPALLVQAQETERRLFASELHDDLSQKLVALSMQVSALSKPSGESPDVTGERIHNLGQKIGKLADDVHRMSHQLHPAILDDLGLEVALRDECTSFSQRRSIPVQFEAKDVPRSLPGDIALCLFRVAQESLRNIAKHAKAKDIRVRLARRKTGLALFIEDSGDGFDVKQATGKGGLGLISMQERVRLVHGEFKIRSRPGVGTKIEVYVPISEKTS